MKRYHARPRDVYRFTLWEYFLAGLAAIVAAPFTYVFMVVFLTWAAGR